MITKNGVAKQTCTKKNLTLLAGIAASSTPSHAALVQISQFGNDISNSAGDNLILDVTGDGHDDEIFGVRYTIFPFETISARLYVNGVKMAKAGQVNPKYAPSSSFVSVGGVSSWGVRTELESKRIRGLVPFSFVDVRIHEATLAVGFLDITAKKFSGGGAIQINRLIFDDTPFAAPAGVDINTYYPEYGSVVPEPSSLSLLALGAGGLIARRRRKAA